MYGRGLGTGSGALAEGSRPGLKASARFLSRLPPGRALNREIRDSPALWPLYPLSAILRLWFTQATPPRSPEVGERSIHKIVKAVHPSPWGEGGRGACPAVAISKCLCVMDIWAGTGRESEDKCSSTLRGRTRSPPRAHTGRGPLSLRSDGQSGEEQKGARRRVWRLACSAARPGSSRAVPVSTHALLYTSCDGQSRL